jgi:hypothetical protein
MGLCAGGEAVAVVGVGLRGVWAVIEASFDHGDPL